MAGRITKEPSKTFHLTINFNLREASNTENVFLRQNTLSTKRDPDWRILTNIMVKEGSTHYSMDFLPLLADTLQIGNQYRAQISIEWARFSPAE